MEVSPGGPPVAVDQHFEKAPMRVNICTRVKVDGTVPFRSEPTWGNCAIYAHPNKFFLGTLAFRRHHLHCYVQTERPFSKLVDISTIEVLHQIA